MSCQLRHGDCNAFIAVSIIEFPVLEQVVNFTEARHGVLAGNIANLDTPGYKTRDLSPELFQATTEGSDRNEVINRFRRRRSAIRWA